jgi:hypothetical protein
VTDLKDQVKEALDAFNKANSAYLKAKREVNRLEGVYDDLYLKYQREMGIRVVVADDQFPYMTPRGVRILRDAVNESLQDPYFTSGDPSLANIKVVSPEGLGPLVDLSEGCFDTITIRDRVALAFVVVLRELGHFPFPPDRFKPGLTMQIPESDDWLLHG